MSIGGIFSLLGGVGLFLFGMSIMSAGLRNTCGDNLQNILEKATKNKFIAVFVGLGMTMLIQSSSATNVMVIGFVNSGMMSLVQAIGVIMGANIGTTITAQITAFNISTFTPLLLFGGAVLYLFIKKNSLKHIGSIFLGFGMLFEGIAIMKAAIAPLSETPEFVDFLSQISNPVLAFVFGVAFTALLQSSSSSTVIFQAFVVQGLLGYDIAVYLLIGAVVGAVTPNILAGLTAHRNGRRCSVLNLVINLIHAGILLALINVCPQILTFIRNLSPNDVGRQIANTHTLFAVIAVCIEIFFTKQIIKLVYRIMPLKPEETEALEDRSLIYMTQFSKIPTSVALHQAQLEIARMGRIAEENLTEAVDCFFDYDEDKAQSVRNREETVNILNHSIADAIVMLRNVDLAPENLRRLSMLTIAITDIERVSDHAENIVEYIEQLRAKKVEMSQDAIAELQKMAKNTIHAFHLAIEIFAAEDYSRLDELEWIESNVDNEEKDFINNHVERLMHSVCSPLSGVIYSDLITDFERCSDHAINLAYALKERPH